MRLGIFGGSFDPVHYGHLLLAEACRQDASLDQVWFVPAAQPPHKPGRRLSEPEHRVELLHLATGGHDAFRVSRVEVDRGGVSYTVDTLQAIHDEFAARSESLDLVLLLGGDSYRDLPTWRTPDKIVALAELAVVERGPPGKPLQPLAELGAHRVRRVSMPRVDLASRRIRRDVAEGRSIRYQTPRGVEEYIRAQGLYRTPDEPIDGRGTRCGSGVDP